MPVETYYINDDGNGGLASGIHHHFRPLRRRGARLITDNNGLLWDSHLTPRRRVALTPPGPPPSPRPTPRLRRRCSSVCLPRAASARPARPEIVTTHASSYLFKYMLKPASAPPRRRRLVFHDKPCSERQHLRTGDAMVGPEIPPCTHCEDCWRCARRQSPVAGGRVTYAHPQPSSATPSTTARVPCPGAGPRTARAPARRGGS